MATYYMIALRDIRADVYTMPEMWAQLNGAIRAFEDRCKDANPKDLVARHPGDFELVVIGEYEDHTGTLLEYQTPDRRSLAVGQRHNDI